MGNTKLLVITVCSQLVILSLVFFFFIQWALTSFHGKNIKVLQDPKCA